MAFISCNHNGVVYHASTLLEGVAHGFSTRLGGVSRGVFASLNFRASGPNPDDRESVQENYRRFCAAVGADPAGLVPMAMARESQPVFSTNSCTSSGRV